MPSTCQALYMCRLFFSNQPHKARIVAQVMDGNRGLESLSLDQIASEWLFCYLNRNPLNSNTQVLSSTPHYLFTKSKIGEKFQNT